MDSPNVNSKFLKFIQQNRKTEKKMKTSVNRYWVMWTLYNT